MTARLALLVALAGCGAATSPAPGGDRPLGARDHLAEAERHEHEAAELDRLAADAEVRPGAVGCGDAVARDQVTSGGERLLVGTPCWSAERSAADRHREAARALRAHAASHRDDARALLAAERRSCASIAEPELEHSPFAHREDVVAVTAILDSDRVRGARVTFRRSRGSEPVKESRALR